MRKLVIISLLISISMMIDSCRAHKGQRKYMVKQVDSIKGS